METTTPAVDAVSEFEGVSLGDRRLDRRLVRLVSHLQKRPAASLPEVFADPSQLEGAYRFIENERIAAEDILAPHQALTAARCAALDKVLVIHDTTTFAFEGGAREGMGVVDPTNKPGFYAHLSLCVGLDGEPLGVARAYAWSRYGKVHGKLSQKVSQYLPDRESLRWNEAVHDVADAIRQAADAQGRRPELIHVMDREGDCLEFLADMIAHDHSFVTRAKTNRRLSPGVGDGGGRLFDEVAQTAAQATRSVTITRRVKEGVSVQQRNPQRKGGRTRKMARTWTEKRTAVLEVRAMSTTIYGAYGHHAHVPKQGLRINVVHVQEVDAPEGVEPVCWYLLTNQPVETVEQIEFVVDCYRRRWLIEEFNKAIKTGCNFEKHQFEHGSRYMRMLAIYLPIAAQMLRARWFDRYRPDAEAAVVFTPDQIDALRAREYQQGRTLPKRPTVAQTLSIVARLGGHLPQNGPAGWLILSRGFTVLNDITAGYCAAREWMRAESRGEEESDEVPDEM